MSSKRIAAVEPSTAAASAAVTEPPRKLRKKSVTAKSLGLTKPEFESIKPALLKKHLKSFVRKLNKQVEDDGHEGWEAQGETAAEWFAALKNPLQAVIDIGVARGIGFAQCHEMLCVIGDGLRDYFACGSKIDPLEMIECCQFEIKMPWGGHKMVGVGEGTVDSIFGHVWRMLLRKAARVKGDGKIDMEVLFQAIKDAKDNGVKLHSSEKDDDESDFFEDEAEKENDEPKGASKAKKNRGEPSSEALDALVDQKEMWGHLDKHVKTFKKRGAIDRRFHGTPERPTRDYHLYPDGGYPLL